MHMTIPPEGPTPLQWLLIELEALPGCQVTKARVLALLRRMAGQRLQLRRRDLLLAERVRLASVLMDSGLTVTETRHQLAARCQCSRDTAERAVKQALINRREGKHGTP